MKTVALRKTRWGLCLAGAIAGLAHGAELTLDFEFPADRVSFADAADGTRVALDGGVPSDLPPGTPDLPSSMATVLVPSGATVRRVEAEGDEVLLRAGIRVAPAQPPQPLSEPKRAHVLPDTAAYAEAALTPPVRARLEGVYTVRGYSLAALRLHPLRYRPATRDLYLAPHLKVTLTYDAPDQPQRAPPRHDRLTRDTLRGLVANPQMLEAKAAWGPVPRAVTPAAGAAAAGTDPVDNLIITSAALTNAFQALASHRARFPGLRTRVLSLTDLYAAYPGADNPMKIRTCISNYVAERGLLFVTLGGDNTVVPVRNCRVSASSYVVDMPTDLYYSGLDGTWNADGDSLYGEPVDNPDLGWDVIVGRITVRDEVQAAAYIAKLIAYERDVPPSNTNRMLLMGRYLWDDYQGDKRPTADVTGDGHLGFRDPAHPKVSDAEFFVRIQFRDSIQPFWKPRGTHYMFDTLTSWDPTVPGSFPMVPTNLVSVFDLGWYYAYMFTHGSYGTWGMESVAFATNNADAITNVTAVIATCACYVGGFDSSTDPCLTEAFLRNVQGGALTIFASARYGWGGSSPYYMDRFSRRLFQTNGVGVGWAFAMHKLDCAPSSLSDGSMRWLQFGHNLQGDPVFGLPWQVPPAPPEALQASKGDPANAIRVRWAPMLGAAPPDTAYRLYRSRTNDAAGAALLAVTSATQYLDTGVAPGETYYYWVKSWHALPGEGAFSAGDGAANAGGTPPLPPADLAASTATAWQVDLTWSATPGAAEYHVYRAPNGVLPETPVCVTNGVSVRDTAVAPGTTYCYWVRAVNAYGTSAVSGPVVGRGVKRDQHIVFAPIPDLPATSVVVLSAEVSSGLPVALAVAAGPGILDGTLLRFEGPGLVTVAASQAGDAFWNPAPPVTQSCAAGLTTQEPLRIETAQPLVFHSTNAISVSGGSGTGAVTLAVVSGPGCLLDASNLWVTAGYGAIVLSASKAGDAHYAARTAGQTAAVARAEQRIAWPAIPDQVATARLTLAATAGSGLPVAFHAVTGPGIVEGAGLDFTGAGAAVLAASQPGNADWLPAPTLTCTIRVSRATALVLLGNLDQYYDGTPRAATAASLPLLPDLQITYNGRATPPINAGRYTVLAQVTDPRYEGAATGILTVAKSCQYILFPPLPDQVETARVTLAATASSGLPVRFGIRSGPGMLDGGAGLRFTAPGTVIVAASQDGNANWDAAPEELRSVRVLPDSPRLSGIRGADFDGDGRADPAVYEARTGTWTALLSGAGYARRVWEALLGEPGWAPAAGDYDGDRLCDKGVYQETSGSWKVVLSGSASGAQVRAGYLGGPGWAPAAADYDGDCRADYGVYREADGAWHVRLSSGGDAPLRLAGLLGGPGRMAAPGDFDGDRRADPTVYARADGSWIILLSGSGYAPLALPGFLGGADWEPVPGDFDGDGRADPAVRRGDGQVWRVRLSGSGYVPIEVRLGL